MTWINSYLRFLYVGYLLFLSIFVAFPFCEAFDLLEMILLKNNYVWNDFYLGDSGWLVIVEHSSFDAMLMLRFESCLETGRCPVNARSSNILVTAKSNA